MKIAFLLGSGISLKAGMPRTSEITEKIISAKNVRRYTLHHYYISKDQESDENVKNIGKFLNFLFQSINKYFKKYQNEHLPNYEDIFYILRQLHDEIRGEQENLIIRQFLKSLEEDVNKQFDFDRRFYPIDKLIDESMDYINNIVTQLLSIDHLKNKCENLKIFKDITHNEGCKSLDIFTLNHDITLEYFFKENKIKICDGIDEEKKGDIRHFDINLYKQNNKINLYKLHGSIDWYRFRYRGKDWRGEFIGKPLSNDLYHLKDEFGDNIALIDRKSKILIGTFNKLLDYNSGIFSDLFCLFKSELNSHNTLIISGYSFGDKGINTKIIEWYYYSENNKIIIIHENPNKLWCYSRNAIGLKWEKWLTDKRLIPIEKRFEDVTWDELKRCIK